jgi:hypothetical protein
MKTRMVRTAAALPVVVLGLLAGPGAGLWSGCVIVDRGLPDDTPGDITFSWSFDGVADCDVAGVDELDVVILQDGEVIDSREGIPCIGGGLTLTDFLPGRYDVSVDAYSRASELLYSADFGVRVAPGAETDVGVVEFVPRGEPPPPPPSVGGLAFFWSFLYPSSDAIVDCARAGVAELDVVLTGPGGASAQQTFACTDDGAQFEGLAAGAWTLSVDAFGTYRDAFVHLYATTLDVTIPAGRTLDLQTLALERDDASFADLDVRWSLTDQTCADAGLTDLTLVIQRDGLADPDDARTVTCADASTVITTFVPGSYTVTLSGSGTTANYVGLATIDAAPNRQLVVSVNLAPQ